MVCTLQINNEVDFPFQNETNSEQKPNYSPLGGAPVENLNMC